MIDGMGRTIDYVRISVTDRCNLRCVYCMPEEGVPMLKHADILTYDEIEYLCKIVVTLGITKVNSVLLEKNTETLRKIVSLAKLYPISIRFIELMPIGLVGQQECWREEDVLPILQREFGEMTRMNQRLGNGPAHYYQWNGEAYNVTDRGIR
ncbi:hypothetical protein ACTQ6A_11265 [Lachnospiraceae bacterium LCP25S3_G4]